MAPGLASLAFLVLGLSAEGQGLVSSQDDCASVDCLIESTMEQTMDDDRHGLMLLQKSATSALQKLNASSDRSDAGGIPKLIEDDMIPTIFKQEADRCAGSWKASVFTPRLTTQEELEEPVVEEIIGRYHEKPVLNRKQWEYIFLLKVLDVVRPSFQNSKAVGFAVGQEPTVAYLASHNVSVIATDLPPSDGRSKAWHDTHQLMPSMQDMNDRSIATPEQMGRYVTQEFVDMNTIESTNVWKQAGTFDFVWSVCSVEHVGSLRQALDFMVKSLQLLSPGGTVVHTTEFNLASLDETVDHEGTVLFRKKDVDAFYTCAIVSGYEMVQPCYDISEGPVDHEIDTPPYSHDRHLRLEIGRYISTCVGMVVRKPINFVDNGYDCANQFEMQGIW